MSNRHTTGSVAGAPVSMAQSPLAFCTVVLLGMLAKDHASMPVSPRTVQVLPWYDRLQ